MGGVPGLPIFGEAVQSGGCTASICGLRLPRPASCCRRRKALSIARQNRPKAMALAHCIRPYNYRAKAGWRRLDNKSPSKSCNVDLTLSSALERVIGAPGMFLRSCWGGVFSNPARPTRRIQRPPARPGIHLTWRPCARQRGGRQRIDPLAKDTRPKRPRHTKTGNGRSSKEHGRTQIISKLRPHTRSTLASNTTWQLRRNSLGLDPRLLGDTPTLSRWSLLTRVLQTRTRQSG